MSELDKQFEKEILNVVKDEDLANAIIHGWKKLSDEEKKKIITYLNKHKEKLKETTEFLKEQGIFEKYVGYDNTEDVELLISVALAPIISGLFVITALSMGEPAFTLGTPENYTLVGLGISGLLAQFTIPFIPEIKKFIDNVKSHIGFKKYIKKLEQKIPKLISTLEERAKGLLHKVV